VEKWAKMSLLGSNDYAAIIADTAAIGLKLNNGQAKAPFSFLNKSQAKTDPFSAFVLRDYCFC